MKRVFMHNRGSQHKCVALWTYTGILHFFLLYFKFNHYENIPGISKFISEKFRNQNYVTKSFSRSVVCNQIKIPIRIIRIDIFKSVKTIFEAVYLLDV